MLNLLGLYEKALPKSMPWAEKLATAKQLGFDFVEISVDESEERLSRLDWSAKQREELSHAFANAQVPLLSMCFSGHRKYPLGSRDPQVRQTSLELMAKAIDFAAAMGIRVIQLAGYDVYYETPGQDTRELFIKGLRQAAGMAARRQVMLAIEIMDTPFINSIQKYLEFDRLIASPWLTVYPDVGNLSAWRNDVGAELTQGISRIVGVHVKETKQVGSSSSGQFRDVPFGEGDVDFVSTFRTLKQLDYQGPFVIEMWGDSLPDPLAEIARSRRFVCDKLKQGGY